MTESFPLKWPLGREKTPAYSRRAAPFNTTPGKARDELLHELKLLGSRDVVISSNVATYHRGGQDIMYADQSKAQEDPGVAVYYTWKGDQYVLSCDKWKTVTDNLQALNKTVNAIRGIERWGTGEMMKQAFAGFKQIAEKAMGRNCFEVLQIDPTTDTAVIAKAYKNLAWAAHPDNGGSTDKFQELQESYQQALNYRR